MNRIATLIVICFPWLLLACNGAKKEAPILSNGLPIIEAEVPNFNSDSAFNFVSSQVDFGPRVPNTKAHRQTGDYIVRKLEEYGLQVVEQNFQAMSFDGETLYLRNIIGTFNGQASKRVLLAAHWDTRPFADKDDERTDEPIDGANDGASGVAVLLEIARQLSISENKPGIGVDFAFFDGEDWGELYQGPRTRPPQEWQSWWCLGSQYWSRNKHAPGYSAYYGILFDMVGGKNAQFRIEGLSDRYARKIARKVWDWGHALGYDHIFKYDIEAEIEDDHKYVNELGKIPMIDIVHYEEPYGYFGSFHHTHDDNIEIIDPQILEAVGSTVLHVLYHE